MEWSSTTAMETTCWSNGGDGVTGMFKFVRGGTVTDEKDPKLVSRGFPP